jgi:hypothetical protein
MNEQSNQSDEKERIRSAKKLKRKTSLFLKKQKLARETLIKDFTTKITAFHEKMKTLKVKNAVSFKKKKSVFFVANFPLIVRERCFLNVSLYIKKKRIKEALLKEENKEREGIRKEAEKRRVQELLKEENKEREEEFLRKEKVRNRFINNVFDKVDKGELLF